MTHLPAYHKPYPMPPLSATLQAHTHRRGLAELGWQTLPVPLLINSMPYNDRPACIRCQHCVGFACPVDAKNGTHNTLIARAATRALPAWHRRDGRAHHGGFGRARDRRVLLCR